MDALGPKLSCSPREFLARLRRSGRSSSDDWSAFQTALSAVDVYRSAKAEGAQAKLRRARLIDMQTDRVAVVDSLKHSRIELFVALSKQIVAQKVLKLAVDVCNSTYTHASLGPDAERLLLWVNEQALRAEADVEIASLIRKD